MPNPFSDLAVQPLRPGDQAVCPSCRGTAIAFVAYYGGLSRFLLRCRCGELFVAAVGAGSQMLQPLAIAVIGGILVSMVLSLIITPAVHFYLSHEERSS